MTELFMAYFYVALFILTFGVIAFSGGRIGLEPVSKKTGARLILAAPVWPVALVLVVVKTLLYWVPRIWREAWS